MDANQKRKLKIKTISQQIYDLEVHQDITIADLKKEIFTKSQVPIDRQRLIFLGKALVDTQKLSDLIKEDDQTIHLMAVTQPQQPQQQPQQNPNQTQPNRQSNFSGTTTTQIHFGQMGPNAMQIEIDGQNIFPPEIANIFGQLINRQPGTSPQPQQPQQVNPPAPTQQPQNPQPQPNQQPQPQPQQQAGQQQPQLQEITFINTEQRGVPVQLPLETIHQLSRQIDSIFSPQACFPGPPLPQMTQNRNNVTVLGHYLHQTCFVIQRALPILQRTADILMREPFQTVQQERASTQFLCKTSAALIQQINRLTQDLVVQVLRNIILGNTPGQYSLQVPPQVILNQQHVHHHPNVHIHATQTTIPRQPQQQPQRQPQSQPSQQPQAPQNQQLDPISFLNQFIQQQREGQNVPQAPQQPTQQTTQQTTQQPTQQQPQQQPQQQTQQQQQNQQPQMQVEQQNQYIIDTQIVEIDVGSDDSSQVDRLTQSIQNEVPNIIQSFLGGQYQNMQPQNQQQLPNNQQSQPSQPQAPPTQQQAGQFQMPAQAQQMMQGLLGGLGMGGQQGGGANLFTMTIQELMMQNYANSMEEGEVEILQIFSCVKVGDLMGAQITGNYSFLDALQGSIRANLHDQISKSEGRIELIDKLANSFLSLVVPKQNQDIVLEGFDPRIIASEILVKHMKQFFQIIEKDYTNSVEKFSEAMVNQFQKMIGETTYEVSEGLINGVDGYRAIIQQNLDELFRKSVGPEMAVMFGGMLSQMLWQFIQKAYTQHKQTLEQAQVIQQEGELTEEQLLKQINEASQACKQQSQIQFSEAYKKGDPNYKNFD